MKTVLTKTLIALCVAALLASGSALAGGFDGYATAHGRGHDYRGGHYDRGHYDRGRHDYRGGHYNRGRHDYRQGYAYRGSHSYRGHYDRGYRSRHDHWRGYGHPYRWSYAPYYFSGYGWPGYVPGYYGGPGYYGPSYYGPRLGLGYSRFGHHDSWGLSLSLPLLLGSGYDRDDDYYDYPDRSYIPAPANRTVYVPPAEQLPADCLQQREYQTEITIGGETKPAYGTACLQPDGSWKAINGPFVADY